MYRKDKQAPTTVLVTLYKVTDSADIELHTTSLVLKEQGEEQTAFRFTLRKDGDVLDYNKLQRRFVGRK
jgi:hypothetical protein